MDRAEFEARLHALVIPDGTPFEEIKRKAAPIREAIIEMMPSSLFRYRTIDGKGERIDAFEKDMIYTVPADWFNDPYDTLVRYDFEGIKKYVETVASPEWLESLRSFFAQGNDFPIEYKQILPIEFWSDLRTKILETTDFRGLSARLENNKQQLLSSVSALFPVISFFGKRFSHIACFSEDVKSILMWSHYADSHKGFALEYDFRSTLNKPLPKGAIYPVIYSDTRYDASSYLTWALFTLLGIKSINTDISASIKAALYKSKHWEYEREWRIIDPGPHNIFNPASTPIEYRPTAIYYGQNIDENHKERLHGIAYAKGIKEYEMFLDNTSPSYEMGYRRI